MKQFYTDSNGNKRKYGIFAPGLDRFVLINDTDFWMVLATAEILSSKIPTMAYILPTLDFDINNDNCLDYTLYNKTQERIGPRLTSIGRQNPALRAMGDRGTLACEGLPEDYKSPEKQEILKRLQEYAQYILKQVQAITMADVMFNPCDNKHFLEKHVGINNLPNFKTMADRSSAPDGALSEIRNALYLADNIEDAEERIIQIWLKYHTEQEYLLVGYYKLLEKEIPEILKNHTDFTLIKLQQFIL